MSDLLPTDIQALIAETEEHLTGTWHVRPLPLVDCACGVHLHAIHSVGAPCLECTRGCHPVKPCRTCGHGLDRHTHLHHKTYCGTCRCPEYRKQRTWPWVAALGLVDTVVWGFVGWGAIGLGGRWM